MRQPLPHIRVLGIGAATLHRFDSLLKGQLNVKQVLLEERPEEFTRKEILPDAKKLGPVLKKDLKIVTARLKEGQFETHQDGSLTVGEHKISSANYSVTYVPIHDDEDVWSDRELVVSLGLGITEALKIEGTARNLNRYIQDLRKKLDLPYDARIILSVEAKGIYHQSLSTHKKWLMEQSLAIELKDSVEKAMVDKSDSDGQVKIQIQDAS